MATSIAAGKIAAHEVSITGGAAAEAFTFADNLDKVEIIWDGAGEGYISTDGTAATDKGTHCFRMPAGAVSVRELPMLGAGKVVSVFADVTSVVSVTKVS